MAEKKIHENPIQEEQIHDQVEKPKDKTVTMMEASKSAQHEKPPTATVPVTVATLPVTPVSQTRVASVPVFTKTPPNDLYRRLLPAVLFLLTFVTVMTMLLIYMDTVALGAQQFRLNMSRDYELASIPQDSSSLVMYVRQLHLAPRQSQDSTLQPMLTRNVAELDKVFGPDYNGTFVEILPSGERDQSTQYLESSRGWSGVVVRAAPRDYLALRGTARALHACLSPTDHPREVAYHEPSESHTAATFSSRVLCLPIYTILLAAEATTADYTVLGGANTLRAITQLPFDKTDLKVLEVRSNDPATRNQTTHYLQTQNYTVLATFEESIMYKLNDV